MFCLNVSSIKPCRLSRMEFMKINASSNSQNLRINVHDFKITRIPKLFTVCMMCKNPCHHRNTVKNTLFNDPTRDSIANNFVIGVYCRYLQILYQIAFFL